ncbi:MAG: hypothetical protein GY913_03835 [Proteobacteria bacterium]|nr:hypothetical protein [Pseudomonadota bacterium]MCP4916033.1 hypothetical protein [Pseudomonadota bacterium]
MLLLTVVVIVLAWVFRGVLTSMFPDFERTGVVASVETYGDETEVVFEDGSWAEGTDPGLSELRVGATTTLSCRHDRDAFPVLQPAWWECTRARLR